MHGLGHLVLWAYVGPYIVSIHGFRVGPGVQKNWVNGQYNSADALMLVTGDIYSRHSVCIAVREELGPTSGESAQKRDDLTAWAYQSFQYIHFTESYT